VNNPQDVPGEKDLITAFRFLLLSEEPLKTHCISALAKKLRDRNSVMIINSHGNPKSFRALANLKNRLFKSNYQPLPAFSLNEYGTYGETAILPIHAVTRHPAGLDAVSAAGLWMAYLTAYGGLVERGTVEGKWVLITAASGGVGSAAIQVARAAGARVIATTRHADKAEKLSAHGDVHVIDTSQEDLPAAVKKITKGHGADFIFDPIAGPTMQSLADAAAEDGVITLLDPEDLSLNAE